MSEPNPQSDEELVRAVLAGRREAFGTLYERYSRRIYSLVLRMVGRQDAEEVTQEAFLQAYRNLAKFRGEAQLYTWLYRVASNTALQHLRRRGRKDSRQSSFDAITENAPGLLADIPGDLYADPVKAAEDAEFQRQTVEVLDTLPKNQKLVILLGPVKGLSYDEMARVLGVTVPVVKARLHRARENLRSRVAALRQGVSSGGSRKAGGRRAAGEAPAKKPAVPTQKVRNQPGASASKESGGGE